MDSWHSYPSIFNVGHKAVADIFTDDVLIEEKVDGSQFSFGLFDDGLRVRSKGQVMLVDAPDKMFQRAVDAVKGLPLTPGWTYRAEYLMKPKHNTLAYDRIPAQHLIVFDINSSQEEYLSWETKAKEAERLGLETVPCLFYGRITNVEQVKALLDTVSVLGGQRIEGVVVKNYARFGPDKKALMAKHVSEAFKEIHKIEWKLANPKSGDILDTLIDAFRTPARWAKAVQHLRDEGRLEGSPRDIGALFKEVPGDVQKECEEEMKAMLFRWAWPRVQRGITAGLAEWYKEQLLASQFEALPKAEPAD